MKSDLNPTIISVTLPKTDEPDSHDHSSNLIPELLHGKVAHELEHTKGKLIGSSYEFIANSFLGAPPKDSANPWRDRFISTAVHLATGQVIATVLPPSIPAYLAQSSATGMREVEQGLKPILEKVERQKQVQQWWDRQVELTGEGPSFSGSAALAKLGVKLSALPCELLNMIKDTLTRTIISGCDTIGLTEKNIASIATHTLDFLARNSPELLEEQAWSMAFQSTEKITNIPTVYDHENETRKYCENIQKKWDETFGKSKQKSDPKLTLGKPTTAQKIEPKQLEELTKAFREKTASFVSFLKSHAENNKYSTDEKKSQPKPQVTKTEIQKTKPNFEDYVMMRHALGDLCEGGAAIAVIIGDHDTAAKFACFGSAATRLIDSTFMLASGTTAAASMSGSSALSMISPLAPYVGILSAAASFVSLFKHKKKKADPRMAQLMAEMQQMCQVVLNQISILHRDTMKRFDGLEKQVDILQKHIIHGFSFLEKEIIDLKVPVLYSLDRIESELKILHTIHNKVDLLLLDKFLESCTDIEKYSSRLEATMTEKEFLKHAKILENILLGEKISHSYMNGMNGKTVSDFSSDNINRTLGSAAPEALLGFLSCYAESELKCILPKTVSSSQLPNLMTHLLGLDRYLTLREQFIVAEYDPSNTQLHQLAKSSESVIAFLKHLQSNKELFEMLFSQYHLAHKKVGLLCAQAMEAKSHEITQSVMATRAMLLKKTIDLSGSFACRIFDIRNRSYAPYDGIHDPYFYATHSSYDNPHDYGVKSINEVAKEHLLRSVIKINVSWPKGALQDSSNPWLKMIDPIYPFIMPMTGQFSSAIYDPHGLGMSFIPGFAEKLGLGYITAEYQLAPEVKISSDWPKDSTKIKYVFRKISTHEALFEIPQGYDGVYTWEKSPYLAMIDQALVKYRKEAIATLLDSSKRGTEYRQALEELDAAYNWLQAFGKLAGFDPNEIEKLKNLANSENIIKHQKAYLSGSPGEGTSWWPTITDSSVLMNRFSRLTEQSSYVTILEIQLARLGLISLQAMVEKQQKKENERFKKLEISEQKEEKGSDLVLEKLELMKQEHQQSLNKLQTTIDKQNEQIALMALLLEQMNRQMNPMTPVLTSFTTPKNSASTVDDDKFNPVPEGTAQLIMAHSKLIKLPMKIAEVNSEIQKTLEQRIIS